MRLETILKRLYEIKDAPDGNKAYQRLEKLIQTLEYKVQEEKERKEKYGKAIQHLVGWYLNLWNNTPPESYGRTNYKAVIGKIFRELLIIYENNNLKIEDLKKDYEKFKEGTGIQNFLLGDKSISRFKQVLPQLKQLEKKNKKTRKKWTSPENERGLDYYLKAVEQEEEPDLSIPNDNEEDIPL